MRRYGAHTVLVDAATRGVAAVSCADAGVQGRVAASLASEFQGCIFVARSIEDYVSVSVRLLQRRSKNSRQHAVSSCARHDEERGDETQDDAAVFARESRHERLADGVAGVLGLMWEEWHARRDEGALAALVQSERGVQ